MNYQNKIEDDVMPHKNFSADLFMKISFPVKFSILNKFWFPLAVRNSFFRLKQIYCKFSFIQNKRNKRSNRQDVVITQGTFVFKCLYIFQRTIKNFGFNNEWKKVCHLS